MRRGVSGVCGLLALLSSAVGGASAQAAVGVDEFLYLRCNATGWGADGSTLLTPTASPGVYALEYDVTAEYMVFGGDSCVVTRTNARNGWGTASTSFGAAAPGVVTAPGRWAIGAVNSPPAVIRYPALGRYRATVDWNARTVSMAGAGQTPPVASYYYYLRCNATGWGLGGATRLAPAAGGLTLTYTVSQPWMVWGGDPCVVTRTQQLDGWANQTALGPSTPTTLTVGATGGATATLVAAGLPFVVRYPAMGAYRATFDPATGKLRIDAPGADVPETGLHGKVEALGGGRVRVTYDFESDAQLSDFVSTDASGTGVSLVGGRLVVSGLNGAGGVHAAALAKGFRVDSLRYQAELLSGYHINVYVGTVWSGAWHPVRGYWAIHRPSGRLLGANGESVATGDSTAVARGKVYDGRIDTTEQGLTWTLDGNAQTLSFPYYGGATRSVVLGGYESTTAFDNLVLEGVVQGMESDGTETDPSAIHGQVVGLPGGRVRISYDFSDAQQKYDFVATQGARRELNGGRLIVSRGSDESPLEVALSKYHLRVDRLSYRAELLAGRHVNVYLDTVWDGSWAPHAGCGGIHRGDGRLFVLNGTPSATSDATPVARLTPYVGEFVRTGTGLSWTLDGLTVASTPCPSADGGAVGLGSYESDVAFDEVVIEGQLE